MNGDKEKTETLRRDLYNANAHVAFTYTEMLRELRKDLGTERASELFKRAVYNHGRNAASKFEVPATLEEFRSWLFDFFPASAAMHEPEVVRCDEEELAVKVPRCPLKDTWRMSGMNDEEVADMCRHVYRFDHGFFGSFPAFEYSMDLWADNPDDACVLHWWPRKEAHSCDPK